MPLYTIVGNVTIDEASTDLEKVKAAAAELCAKHSDLGGADFVVVEVREIGRYEKVSPVWISQPSERSDEIPF